MQVFVNQPWWEMHASLILLLGKTKTLFGKDAANVENEREPSEQI